MRWERLFADLEGQLAAGAAAQGRWDVADLVRAERAHVRLADRARAGAGARVRVLLADAGEPLDGELLEAGDDWVLLALSERRRALVPLCAVDVVAGLPHAVAPPAGHVERALGLGHALRALARDRATVQVRTRGGAVTGRLERVGADHVDLTPDQPAARTVSVPFAALCAVVSA
ncbi:hypothetical protein GC089_06260 [Cellulomonas sp. JZ18]|uniref:hypothetical protein n=1 Tax=Cellulomonas sp. JZ18 TaxID=2654191 RepID=UPI0012D3DC56|nr:hypothetical protein [Cellulomonas sp. JZ18]QGQ18916.1 hypothetical protein GC089_06260 [Cellulomonas sp. JZ18]